MHKSVQLRRARLAMAPAFFADAPSGLEIAALRVWRLREPVSRRTYSVLRVRTKSGITGYGECASASAAEVAETGAVDQRQTGHFL